MIITCTELPGVLLIEPEPMGDARGFFARTFCVRELQDAGVSFSVCQCNLSGNTHKGTLRGMHYQLPPLAEAKLVSCDRGAIHDVVVDIREDSTTFHQHLGIELSASNRRQLYIPEGFAHGFQTLADNTEVRYLMGEFYAPGQARGLRHDDPQLGLDWPLPVSEISERDLDWPLLGDPA